MSETVTLNLRGLDQLAKALKVDPPRCRVGILGTTARTAKPGEKAPLTNAEIGAIYEFDEGRNPNRPGGSFLRVPLIDRLDTELENSGAFDKKTLANVIKDGSITPWLEKVAVVAEKIVLGAFATGGYGKWKPSDMKYKKNAQTLVETKQLRDSITSKVGD